MDHPTEPPVLPNGRGQNAVLLKVGAIGVLLLLLQVPLFLTHRLVRERKQYQAQATNEVSATWGREQAIIGPVLAVPYVYHGQKDIAATAYFLPDDLAVDTVMEPEIRHRGIYDVVVYTAHLKLKGSIHADFAAAGIDALRIDWARSRLLVGVSDVHGLRSLTPLHRPDGVDAPFEATENGTPGMLALAANAGVSGPTATLPFSLEAVVQGSDALRIAPVGKNTTARMQSPWNSPSFVGSWLPVTRHLSGAGFTAEWTIPPFGRGFPQSWTTLTGAEADMTRTLNGAGFGVRLGQGVDGYGIVERAQKYGILFFVLVFAVFFLFEVRAKLRIHPLQYAMVGAALCLFFLGFLALSEFCPNALAYAVSAGACTAMVSLYAWSFLRSGARTLVVGGGLAATYAYLYFVLKSEDYALIAGTAAVFAMLAIAMFVTRRINWYALEPTSRPAN